MCVCAHTHLAMNVATHSNMLVFRDGHVHDGRFRLQYVAHLYVWMCTCMYVTSSCILCHIIMHTMSHHHAYYVTSSCILCLDVCMHTMSHHHAYYVTSSCILCHIIMHTMFGSVHACMHVSTCVLVCVHVYVHVCVHVCLHVYLHVCVHVCMHVCVHARTHGWMNGWMHACCMYPLSMCRVPVCMHASAFDVHVCVRV